MTSEVQFTQTHAEKLATMDTKLDSISSDVRELKEYWGQCYGKMNADLLDIQLHGSERVKLLEAQVLQLQGDHKSLKSQVDYERGRLAFIFIGVGAGISALISWWISNSGGS
jgi:outer membrane murein-binding lipoprotein Lpp